MMKMWRVYQMLRDGKHRCIHRSYKREPAETMAWIVSLMHIPHVAAVEMRSPDGLVWRRDMPPPATPEQIKAAEDHLLTLEPDELERRKNKAGAEVSSFFASLEPPISPVVERAMEKFRNRMIEMGPRDGYPGPRGHEKIWKV